MKKVLLLLICSLLVTGCASKPTPTPTPTSTPTPATVESSKPSATEETDTVIASDSQGEISIHLPALAFEGKTKEEIESSVSEKGFKEVKINEDGSVDLKMEKKLHQELMARLNEELINSIQETLSNKEEYPAFEEINYNESLTEFTIVCKTQELNMSESMTPLLLMFTSALYQSFNATPDAKIIINFQDKKTGEIFNTFDSTEMGN